MDVGGVEPPQVGFVLEEPTGVVVIEYSGPHPFGASRRPRRVVHGTGERIRSQFSAPTVEERSEAGVVENGERGLGVGDQGIALAGEESGVQENGDDAASQGAQHADEQGGRRRTAEGHPVTGTEAGGHESPGGTALGVLGRRRIEQGEFGGGHRGTAALSRRSSSRARNRVGRTTVRPAITRARRTPEATVTSRIPTAPAMAPSTTRPMG